MEYSIKNFYEWKWTKKRIFIEINCHWRGLGDEVRTPIWKLKIPIIIFFSNLPWVRQLCRSQFIECQESGKLESWMNPESMTHFHRCFIKLNPLSHNKMQQSVWTLKAKALSRAWILIENCNKIFSSSIKSSSVCIIYNEENLILQDNFAKIFPILFQNLLNINESFVNNCTDIVIYPFHFEAKITIKRTVMTQRKINYYLIQPESNNLQLWFPPDSFQPESRW